jgi:hypothetical protein
MTGDVPSGMMSRVSSFHFYSGKTHIRLEFSMLATTYLRLSLGSSYFQLAVLHHTDSSPWIIVMQGRFEDIKKQDSWSWYRKKKQGRMACCSPMEYVDNYPGRPWLPCLDIRTDCATLEERHHNITANKSPVSVHLLINPN